jgi:spiro-SPASM protein
MSSILCLNATEESAYTTLQLVDGLSAADMVAQYGSSLTDLREVVLLVPEGSDGAAYPGEWRRIARSAWTDGALLETLHGLEADEVIYAYADAPFLSAELTETMRANHRSYIAEYTFAEGYPQGVTPEIVTPDAAERLRSLCREPDHPADRGSLFRVLQTDINAFDVETELSPVDCRMLRLELFCNTRRNFLLCKRLLEHGGRNTDALLETVQERGDLLRTLPAFLSLQVVDAASQAPAHLPAVTGVEVKEQAGRELGPDDARRLVERLADFAPEAMLHVSLWGEIGLHSDPEGLIRALRSASTFQVVVETSGVGWDRQVARSCVELPDVIWILALDANDEGLYSQIRGNGFAEAQQFAELLMEVASERSYIQATRMDSNEEHLQSFYESWSERTNNIIVQKYDHFIGTLADRRVSDISPLVRMPCWHLKRDLYILLDGTVPMCREDLKKEHVLGNLYTDELATIWERGQHYHERHVAEEYPALCAACDEYYTFNN